MSCKSKNEKGIVPSSNSHQRNETLLLKHVPLFSALHASYFNVVITVVLLFYSPLRSQAWLWLRVGQKCEQVASETDKDVVDQKRLGDTGSDDKKEM